MQDPVWTSQYIGMSGMCWADTGTLRREDGERDQTRPVMTADPLGKGRFTTSQAQRLTLEKALLAAFTTPLHLSLTSMNRPEEEAQEEEERRTRRKTGETVLVKIFRIILAAGIKTLACFDIYV